MTDKRIKSTPGGAGPTTCAKPSTEAYRNNKFWDKPKKEDKK